jgi:very-short-patch-repair endonuclease
MVGSVQLRAFGVGRGAIAYRVRVGRLHVFLTGVYSVGHGAVTREGRFIGSVLWAGDGAALSHFSAAALWGLIRDVDLPVDVTVARAIRATRGVRVHRTRRLAPKERTTHLRIPVTTVPRTLLDLADVAYDRLLTRAVREAFVQDLATERDLEAQLARSHGRRGAPRLAALIADGPDRTHSVLEDCLRDLLREHDLPTPLMNVVPPGLPRRIKVDFLFPDQRVVIECDGARYHDNRLARRDDAEKQAILEAAGYRVIRVTWDQVTRRPAETVARIRAALAYPDASRPSSSRHPEK